MFVGEDAFTSCYTTAQFDLVHAEKLTHNYANARARTYVRLYVHTRIVAIRYNCTTPKRFCGSAKPFGPSYPQAREVVGEGAGLDGLWTVYSINKEDVGVTFAPIASLKE